MSVVDDLKQQIKDKKIIFDKPELEKELLGENAGTTKVTSILQELVLAVSKLKNIRISSIIRQEGHHGTGRAFDVGNEVIANELLPSVATDAQVKSLKIDEIIFDAKVAGESDRNKWNYNEGQKHSYGDKTLDAHKNHIHFAVKAS
jgi:hypothetical protein